MKFCEKCGSHLRISKKKDDGKALMYLQCPRCGFTKTLEETFTRPETEPLEDQIKVVSDEVDYKTMPTSEVECPKCGNNTAYWWLLQTRSGDEATTQFYRCTQCSHTWREYA